MRVWCEQRALLYVNKYRGNNFFFFSWRKVRDRIFVWRRDRYTRCAQRNNGGGDATRIPAAGVFFYIMVEM